MRRVTRSRYYGRSAITGALRSSAADLANLAALLPEPTGESPLVKGLRQVIKGLEGAVTAYDVYKIARKRLKAALIREHQHLSALLDKVLIMPVLPEEKIIAKNNRARTRGKPKKKQDAKKKK